MSGNKTIMVFLIVVLISLISSAVVATIGITTPPSMQLMPGEEGRFEFQVQSTSEMVCTPVLQGESPLNIVFDDNEITLPAPANNQPSIAFVRGTVKVPKDATLNDKYSQKFCISCEPAEKSSGTGTKLTYCTGSVDVTVVKQRTKENVYVPPTKSTTSVLLVAVLIVAILFMLVFIYIYLLKSGKKSSPGQQSSVKKRKILKKGGSKKTRKK